jgi:hypothetical protein
METGLFEMQADHLREFRQARRIDSHSPKIVYAMFARADAVDPDRAPPCIATGTETVPGPGPEPVDPTADLARCFLRLANLPSSTLDRLSDALPVARLSMGLSELRLIGRDGGWVGDHGAAMAVVCRHKTSGNVIAKQRDVGRIGAVIYAEHSARPGAVCRIAEGRGGPVQIPPLADRRASSAPLSCAIQAAAGRNHILRSLHRRVGAVRLWHRPHVSTRVSTRGARKVLIFPPTG